MSKSFQNLFLEHFAIVRNDLYLMHHIVLESGNAISNLDFIQFL